MVVHVYSAIRDRSLKLKDIDLRDLIEKVVGKCMQIYRLLILEKHAPKATIMVGLGWGTIVSTLFGSEITANQSAPVSFHFGMYEY